jgi:uncharacterized protein (DUF1501 family)
MTTSSRRRFLQTTLGSSALLSSGLAVPTFLARSAWAVADDANRNGQGSQENVLVVVQLSGGNDGLNTVIPYADPAYNKNRILLRIGRGEVLKVDNDVGLHPRMEGFSKLLEANRLAIVQGVGYPNPNRSHFESMDIWHSAQPGAAGQEYDPLKASTRARLGWLGRMLDQQRRTGGQTAAKSAQPPAQDVPALYLGENELPLALVARETPVPAFDSLESFRLQTAGGAVPSRVLRELSAAERPAAPPLTDFVRRSMLNALDSSEKVQEAIRADKSTVKYPGYGLATKLRNVARLIDAGLKTRIYYVALDGFDTHANQRDAHAGLLDELASSVKAFLDDLAHRGHLDRVLVMSFSEFGRRVRENASSGTDHGAAAPLFLAGGKVRPGLIGKHPSLTALDREGDMQFHTDFRQVYATLLDCWLGCESAAVLGEKFKHVDMLKG